MASEKEYTLDSKDIDILRALQHNARLTNKELVITYTFNDDEAPAKGTYTFTLTYVPAK